MTAFSRAHWTATALACALSTSPFTPAAADIFPDKNLEAAVRQYVFAKRDNDMPLTEDDVKNLSTVVARKKGIKDLTGLEKCRALAEVNFTGNEITDLSPFRELKILQSLDLSNNKIKDLGPLSGLAGLQYLQLAGNEISDLAPIAKLEKLTSLYLAKNKVKDLGPVSGLKKLWSLYLDGNEVEDLKPIAELKGLTSLDLRNNKIKDLAPIAAMNQLQYLLLDGNQVADVSVLLAMAKKDLEKEKRFAPYWQIYLSGNPVPDEQVAELKKHAKEVKFEKK